MNMTRSLNSEVKAIDATSDRSTFPTEEVITCYLEDEDRWRRRFPRAELCVVGSAFGGFLVITGVIMIALHYTLESRKGFHSLMEHLNVATHLLGLAFVALAGAFFVSALFAYAVWKVMEVVEMAHRYREHRELCAYEDLRQSFRSQQSIRSQQGMRFDSTRCMVDLAKYHVEDKANVDK